MNSAIAAASLLGFGDKPASESLQSFSTTLGKLYDVQSQKAKTDEKSRKSVLDEYNKSQRAKKKRESDFSEFLKNLKAKNEGQKVKPSEGKEGGSGLLGLLGLGLLGTMGTALIGKLIFDAVKGKLMDFINPVVDLINEKLQPIYDFVKGLGDKIGDVVKAGTEKFTEIVDSVKEFFGIPVEKEMSYFGDDYKEQELALAAAAEESRSLTPEAEESETETPSEQTSSDWAPVLDMIASAESNGRYDVMYGGEIVDGITEMTIAEAAKRAGDRGDGKNYAVGKYQFITLTKQAEASGLDPDKDLFSPKNQDKIAIDLITKKRGVTKQMAKKNPTEAAKRLAMEWAGLPVLKDTQGYKKDVTRGQSYYAGDDVNSATVSPEAVEASFQKLQKGGITKQISSSGKMMSPVVEMAQKQQQFVQNQQKRKGKNGAPSEDSVAPQGMPVQKRARGGKIFLHWAGSGYSGAHPNYHATIQGDGSVSKTRDYGTVGGGHTHLRNDQGIGISLAAMKDASDKDFGSFPVRPQQYEGMSKLVADIATSRGWSAADINVRNVMTHAEAASGKDGQLPGNDNYGPTSWGGDGARWDLWKLYQNDPEGSGGGKIRNMIRAKMGGKPQEEESSETPTTSTSSPSTTPTTPERSTTSERSTTPSVENIIRPQGVLPSAPTLDVPEVQTMEQLGSQLGKQLLAPLFGFLGAITGKPLDTGDGEDTTPTPFGSGEGGATSITNPNAKALLNAIADAEGTSQYPEQGYRTMFTGKQFSGEWKHPKQVQTSSGYRSDAAGRYQFLSTTWEEMGMQDFSPANQDQAALKLLSQAGVNISDGLSEQEIYKVGQKWASVEGGRTATKGGSYGAQAKYSATQFMQMYKGYGGEPQKLQQGGTVGQQINRGTMKGSNNIQMTRLREAQQKTRKKRGPQVITIPMPPTPAPPVSAPAGENGSFLSQGSGLTASALADSNRRLAMGATG